MQNSTDKSLFNPYASSGGTIVLPELDEDVELDQPWNVVVHNDPVNLMTYVVKVFIKVFGFSLEKAEKHMWEVHKKGRSILWSGERERGELYVQQLHSYLLLATLERSL
ncbi:MAG: ATP-dependent Clp protease adapter ClpS [Verrucomicrobiota bacterium]